MDFKEKEALIRRISAKRLYGSVEFIYDKYNVIINDPSLDILCEADWIYQTKYNEYKEKGGMTLEESYKLLEEQKLWSKSQDEEIDKLKKTIKDFKYKLPSLKYLKNQERVVKEAIKNAEKKINDLFNIKHQLWQNTIEYLCLLEKRKFILSKITQVAPSNLLLDSNFLNRLSVYYYEESNVHEEKIRELARTDPWRLYWTVSKETGTSLFQHSSVEMSELQYALVTWSKVYDFAYESQNRPSDEVLADDALFDAWYESESNRIKSEIRNNNINSDIGGSHDKAIAIHEKLIPADSEGAKEVYSMNSIDVKSRINQRQKALLKEGQLTEANLPDVKRDLLIAANKATR